MIKSELISIINANRIINKNKDILSVVKNRKISDKDRWFPKIDDLKEEFDILSKEVENSLVESKKYEKIIQNKSCNHEVRLEHYGLFGSHTTVCIFCGKSISSDNCVNFEYSINRNRYCVNLIAKYQDDDDYLDVSRGYTNEDVYKIIMNILKSKKDDEEVDLIQEFKKMNLKHCRINEEKTVNENYILIIGGTNKQYIDKESYIYKKSLKKSLDFFNYFSKLLNTKVELIDNIEIFLDNNDKEKYFPKNNYNLKFKSYETNDDLEQILLLQKDIPFKLIIDLSEQYNYKNCNNSITKESYNIELNKYFPNSKIIKINNLSNNSLEELLVYLKSNLNNVYAYQDDKFYYSENSELKSDNLEKTCGKIKQLLKNKTYE